jgi:putative transposase
MVSHGALRVRLDVSNVQADVLLRAAGARRFAWNWAVEKVAAVLPGEAGTSRPRVSVV